jgi:prepilin-type N-terminal cleavage/methylation domain-containing protein
MNVQQKNKEKGFTIIEVVLVLAIAGLIFLMVFIALPSLQRGQRDAQRKNDMSRAMTAVNNYQSNNRGVAPSNWTDFATKYLEVNGDTFADPSGTNYIFAPGTTKPVISDTFDGSSPKIYATKGATCDGEDIDLGKGANKIALQMKLEGGGISCQSN